MTEEEGGLEDTEEEEEYSPEYYDEVWLEDIKPETRQFLFKVFYPFIGFRPKARSNKAWRRNLKVLLDWGTVEWDEKDHYVRFQFRHPRSIISIMRRTLVLPEEYANRRDEFFSHLEELMDPGRICGYSVIFPLGTEDRLWYWLEEQGVGDKEGFEDLKEEILREFGPLPYTYVMISKDASDRIDKVIKDTKLWSDKSDFIEEAVRDKLCQLSELKDSS